MRLIPLFCLLFSAASCLAASATSDAQFLAAHKLARAGLPWQAAAKGLEAHPLRVYLEHVALMRAQRPDREAMQGFIDQHDDGPLRREVVRHLINRQIERRDYAAVLALDADWLPLHEHCHVWTARLADPSADVQALAEPARGFWTRPVSLPLACNPLMHWLREHKLLDRDTVWQRFELAVLAGQIGLARSLVTDLPKTDQTAATQMLAVLANPASGRKSFKSWRDDAPHQRALAVLLRRLASRDDDLAASWWREQSPRFALSEAQRHAVIDAIALYRANSFRDDAASWLDLLPVGSDSAATREWRLREALARDDSKAIAAAVARFDAAQQADPRFHYWIARSQEKAGDTNAAAATWRELARSPTFFGFLAAEKAGLPYALCPLQAPAAEVAGARIASHPGFVRALHLHRIGWISEARREWDVAINRAPTDIRVAAVRLAEQAGWFDRAPFALTRGDELRHYDLRFALAHRDLIVAAATRHQLSPAFVYGLIRSESAWVEDAVSSANAHGLMQLLPETARRMARLEKTALANPRALHAPALNVPLGTRYLGSVLDRFDGAHWLAAAAYNAGPNKVDAWLEQRGHLEIDAFIETIPYRETREYIARVLAFAVIYDWRLNGRAFSLQYALSRPEETPPPRRAVACPSVETAGAAAVAAPVR